MFKSTKHTEGNHVRKPKDKHFLFETEDRKKISVGESFLSFETNERIVGNFSKERFNDIKYPYAYTKENINFMLHRKNITIEEFKNSIQKDECEYMCK